MPLSRVLLVPSIPDVDETTAKGPWLIIASIMAAAAGTLFVEGISMSKASQMIGILETTCGEFSHRYFCVWVNCRGGIIAISKYSHAAMVTM